MRFLVAFKNDKGTSLKIAIPGTDGKEKEVWMSCPQVVYGFAKKTLRGNERDSGYTGDEVIVTYTQENGKYNATRIEKIGGSTANPQTRTDGKPTCTDCGKELKDNKYTKCYLCNQKNPSKSQTPAEGNYVCSDCGASLKDGKYKKCYTCNKKNPVPGSKDRGSNVNASIKRQAIGHMTSRSLVALQGTLDLNTIQDVIRSLYKLYTELVG